MIPYWSMLLVCSLFAIHEGGRSFERRPAKIGFLLVALLFTLMIGLRYDVGGDWGSYASHFSLVSYMDLAGVLSMEDPGYYLVNWVANSLGAGIWGVNLFCGAIFAWGLAAFARTLPRPWLAILVAVPYLVIVVAMGYSRQGVAIGFVLLGLAAFQKRQIARTIFWIIIAVAFHKTALIMLPLIGLSLSKNRVVAALALGAVLAALYYLFIVDEMRQLISGYIEQEYDSQGALIRITMNAVPAIIFLIFRNRFDLFLDQYRFWRNISLLALACLPILYVSASSTVVDRLALYLIPLQLFVLSWLPLVFGKGGRPSGLALGIILAYSIAIQFVWLNFASHADDWIPYRSYLTPGQLETY